MTNLSETTLLAFVDGELDAAAAKDIARELTHDPVATETVRQLQTAAAAVRDAFAEPEWQTVPARLVATAEGRPARRWLVNRRQVGFSLAASIAASIAACATGFAGGVAFGRLGPQPAPPGEHLLAEVAEYHAALAGEVGRPGIVPASKLAEIKSWFSGVLGRPVPIPDLGRFGLAFRGARMLIVDGRPVTQLLYAEPGRDGHPLGLCIAAWPGAAVPLRSERREGLALALWAHAGFAYLLVGWTDPGRLKHIAVALAPVLERT